MNILDIGIILIFLSAMAIGSKNGVIKEAINFIGIIIVFVASYILKGYVGHYICLYFPFMTFKNTPMEGLTTFNIFIYEVAAFILVFLVLLGFYAILVKGSELVQKLVNMTIILKPISMILGAIVALIECWVLMFIIVVAASFTLGTKDIYQESKLTSAILYKTPFLSSYVSPFTKSLKEVYQVVEKAAKIDRKKDKDYKKKVEKANLSCLEIMLKYKLVDKQTVKDCIENGQLEKQEGMDKLIK